MRHQSIYTKYTTIHAEGGAKSSTIAKEIAKVAEANEIKIVITCETIKGGKVEYVNMQCAHGTFAIRITEFPNCIGLADVTIDMQGEYKTEKANAIASAIKFLTGTK